MACTPVPAFASTVTPSFDPAEISSMRSEANARFISQTGTGLATAAYPRFSALGRSAHSGVLRQRGRSATPGNRLLFVKSLAAEQAIGLDIATGSLDIATSSLCGSASSGDCVASYTSNNFTDVKTTVPIPAAVLLFASGLLGMIGLFRRGTPEAE
jgi:hypothetical protein